LDLRPSVINFRKDAARHYHTRLFVNDGFNAQLPVQSNSF
jgi:hypothetical protein